MELTTDDIKDLIMFGRTANVDQDLHLTFQHRDYINRQHWNNWNNSADNLSDLELISVYKALINLERRLKWIGGSVAGAIWVYNIISQRRLDENYILADYGLQNSDNPYVPFGTSYYGRRNIQDFFLNQKEQSRIRAMKAEENENQLKRVKGRNERRSAAIAELRKLSFEERGSIRTLFLEKFGTATIQQRLKVIADDEKFPPEYYPVEWIKIGRDQIQELPIELVRKLFDKLSTKTKGVWKRFAQELRNREEGFDSR